MKPFNLEAALKGEKVVTRDGREVTDIHVLHSATTEYKLVAVIDGSIYNRRPDGTGMLNNSQSPLDFFMAPKKVYVNFYDHGVCCYFETEKQARDAASVVEPTQRAVPIEIEGGDFFRAPKKRTVYVNLYKNTTSWHYDTKEEAVKKHDPDYAIGVAIPVEIEE
jgi:hypothetical protein